MDHNFISKQLLRKQNEIWDEFDAANPPELLHFTCPSSCSSIIESGEIWGTDVVNVNDPREGDYGLEVVQSVVSREEARLDKEFAAAVMASKSLFGLKEFWSLHIACFCTDELQYMWEKYACEGTGAAIGFDHDALIAGAKGGKEYALFRVLYDRKTQEGRVKATLEHAIALELTMNLAPADRQQFWMQEVPLALITCASRFKHPKWRAENEFRMSVTDPSDTRTFRSGEKSRIRIPFPPNAITRVIRGPRSGAVLDVDALRQLLDRRGFSSSVKIVDAQK